MIKKERYRPIHILPFKLHNIEDFLTHKKREIINPLESRYKKYWTNETKRCIEGHWGHDYKDGEGGWRWMPGSLYFYINMTPIKKEGDFGSEIEGAPDLRDIEWKLFYGLTACDGFSGFDGDEEYTCYRPIEKLEKGEKLMNYEKILLDRYSQYLKKPDGTYKKYMEARDYLYRTHKNPIKGKPMYLNEALNLILLSTRRLGKSYSIGNGVISYDFTFNGSKSLEDYLERKTSSTVVVGSAESKFSKELLSKFESTHDYLKKEIGAFSSATGSSNGCFWTPYEGSLQSGKNITNKIKTKGGKGFMGVGSKVVHVSYADNPNAGVGYAARRSIIEEAGLLGKFKEVHSENSAAQRRNTKFGYSIYIGTGGNIEKIKGIREAFYKPKGFEALPYKDIFNGTDNDIGLFFPGYYINNDFRDENGNLDVEKAFEDEMDRRNKLKQDSSTAYNRHTISFPLVPQEMFLNNSGNIFPTDKLEERITFLESGGWDEAIRGIGDFVYIDKERKKVSFRQAPREKAFVKRYRDEIELTQEELQSAFMIYEHPVHGKPEPTFKDPLYIVWYDPVKNDGSGSSLACVIIFKTWYFEDKNLINYNIVGEWYGRHTLNEDNHDMAFKAARYYGAKVFSEINDEDIKRHARASGNWELMQPTPGLVLTGDLKEDATKVGLKVSSNGMISKLDRNLNELLHTVVDSEERIEGSKYVSTKIKMVEQMNSLRACEELYYYDGESNFDSVSTMRVGATWIRGQFLNKYKQEDVEYEEKIKKYSDFLKSGQIKQHDNPAFNW